ncbi:sensor histidine kinase [Candidatus Woesearchaeota archaeon]|nr:sensor histidine kinase [Candidatus Woesearchaeota archaeon]
MADEELKKLDLMLDRYISSFPDRLSEEVKSLPKIDIDMVMSVWDMYLEAIKSGKDERTIQNLHEKIKNTGKSLEIDVIRMWKRLFYDPLSMEINSKIGDALADDQILMAFLGHDHAHLCTDISSQYKIITSAPEKTSSFIMENQREQVRAFLELHNTNPEYIFSHWINVNKMIHYIVTSKLGRKPKAELIIPADITMQTAMTLQRRSHRDAYSIVSRLSDTDANEIAVDAEYFKVVGNSGLIFSIIYNLAKNAYKKISKFKPNNSQKIALQVYEPSYLGSCYIITVADNGGPIDLNAMKDVLRETIKAQGIENLKFPNTAIERKFRKWQQSGYSVKDITIGDITDIAFMGRMSGFEMEGQFSSGMGLYGVRYLVQNLGGKILYGEDFNTGGPMFTCILPKKMNSYGGRLAAALQSKILTLSGDPRPALPKAA